jgi:glutamate-1-semialdehyde 2,1-aminomutase
MTHLVGGISSAGRAMPDLDGARLVIVRSAGPYLWDDQGRRYIDYLCGMGADFLGHAPPSVVAAVTRALEQGPMPGLAHPLEEAAAAALAAHTGALDQVVFLNSGSEAVHLACRVARAVTGRGRIAKFAAGFDGWLDDVAFGNTGSEAAAMRGNARPLTARTALLRYNDPEDVERLFAEHDDIAGILVEPVLANAGCIAEAPGYLAHLQDVARRHGALVIADEVLMGFRLHAGLTSAALGLDPDLATVGKAIGSGMAVAALVGRAAVMAGFTDGRIARAGTYSGNPPACAAVLATMAALDALDYPSLLARGDRLRDGIVAALRNAGQPASTSGYGSVFSLWFADAPPADYRAAEALADAPRSLALHLALRRCGVMTLRSPFGRMFLSAAHGEADVDQTIAAFAQVAGEIAEGVARR